jgi:hypothetical protein
MARPLSEHFDEQGYVRSTVRRGLGRGRERLHRVIASRVIGRPIGRAVVHHVDDDRANNRNDNLVVLENQGEHASLHYRRDVLRAGGDPFSDALCALCRSVHPKAESFKQAGGSWRGRACDNAYKRERYARNLHTVRAYWRAYRQRNRAAVNAQQRARRAARRAEREAQS